MLLTIPIGFRVSNLNILVVVGVLILSILIFAAIGNVGAAIVVVFQQGMAVIAGALSIIGVVSGTLFPVSELPAWLQVVSHMSPLTYALDALRSATLAGQPATSYSEDLLVLLGFVVVLVPLSALLLEKAFSVAQRQGTLSTY